MTQQKRTTLSRSEILDLAFRARIRAASRPGLDLADAAERTLGQKSRASSAVAVHVAPPIAEDMLLHLYDRFGSAINNPDLTDQIFDALDAALKTRAAEVRS